jgi:hypothetical protein
VVLFAGRLTEADGIPEVTVGAAENTHVDAPVTDAESLTVPPVEVRIAGVAVKDLTIGAGGPATVTMAGAAVTVVFFALAIRWKV